MSQIVDQNNSIKKKLEADKDHLLKQIADLSSQDPFSNPDRLTDNADAGAEATEESNHDRYRALLDELEREVSDIDSALSRVADGSYGICEGCGSAIEEARLLLLPTTRMCIACGKK